MAIEVRPIRNPALIKEILGETWDIQTEDDTSFEEYLPEINLPGLYWLGFSNGTQAVGLALVQPFTKTLAMTHVAFRQSQMGKKNENAEFGRLALDWIWQNTKYDKLQGLTSLPAAQAYAQRIGFKREGILRASWRKNGQLQDQHILGLQRPK